MLLGVDRAAAAVLDLAAKGYKIAIVLASGYGESGAVSLDRREGLQMAAGTMRLLGPNTIPSGQWICRAGSSF